MSKELRDMKNKMNELKYVLKGNLFECVCDLEQHDLSTIEEFKQTKSDMLSKIKELRKMEHMLISDVKDLVELEYKVGQYEKLYRSKFDKVRVEIVRTVCDVYNEYRKKYSCEEFNDEHKKDMRDTLRLHGMEVEEVCCAFELNSKCTILIRMDGVTFSCIENYFIDDEDVKYAWSLILNKLWN